jgi:S-adenosylmethionine hydrolase
MKPMIVLQTDFSETWGAVASMKGVIKKVDRELEIQDLCQHQEIRSV